MVNQTLYEAVGGEPTLQRVHKIFYDKVYAHPWLGKFFAGHDQTAIEGRQTSFMGEKMGGPKYLGKPLRQVHEHMYVTPELSDLRHELLAQSLVEAGISSSLAERWLKIDAAFMKQVTKPSLESFYRDYHFAYKRRIIHPEPPSVTD